MAKKSARKKSTKKRATAKRASPRRAAAKRTTRSRSGQLRHRPTPGLQGWITHTELQSADPLATKSWCAKVLGWTFTQTMPMPDGATYSQTAPSAAEQDEAAPEPEGHTHAPGEEH